MLRDDSSPPLLIADNALPSDVIPQSKIDTSAVLADLVILDIRAQAVRRAQRHALRLPPAGSSIIPAVGLRLPCQGGLCQGHRG
eukprot:12514500-Alexandrium_andersonii.AAC.1